MNCPKCGTPQADRREECSACGLVFARWQERQQRPRTGTSTPVPGGPNAERIPPAFIAIAALLVILAGLVWMKHHRATQDQGVTSDQMLNAINNAQVAKLKAQRARLIAQEQQSRPASARAPLTLPPDLDEQTIRGLLEQCGYFSSPVTVSLPKSFHANLYAWTVERYPSLPAASMQGFVTFDPPFDRRSVPRGAPNPVDPGSTITVNLSAPPSIVGAESADEYHLDLGQRRIETITPLQVLDSKVLVRFTWNLDHGAGANLAPEGSERSATGEFVRTGGRWFASAWRITNNTSTMLCQ